MRRRKTKLVGFRADQALARAVEELATEAHGRSVSEWVRRLIVEQVNAHRGELSEETRKLLDNTNRIRGRHIYRPTLGHD